MLTYGDLRRWDPDGLTTASEDLRSDLKTLEKARDDLDSKAVPSTWTGVSRIFGGIRKTALVNQMDAHLDGVRTFERAIYQQQTRVASIKTRVEDIEADARTQEFAIGHDGSVTDGATPPTFHSRFEAEEYGATRTNLREALVDRIESVLDDAYDVDSVLVHARPTDSFSAEGPQEVIDPEVERQWAQMSPAERRAVLEQMAEELARENGVGDFEVRYEDLEDADGDGKDDDPTTDTFGSWAGDERVLRIDVNNLDDPQIINTVAHEVRHAIQDEQIRDLNPGPFDRALIEAGLKDDPFNPPPGVTREEVEEWAENDEDYKTVEDDGYDAYHDQPLESDAREAGEEYLDGLTGDELERHRREAR